MPPAPQTIQDNLVEGTTAHDQLACVNMWDKAARPGWPSDEQWPSSTSSDGSSPRELSRPSQPSFSNERQLGFLKMLQKLAVCY